MERRQTEKSRQKPSENSTEIQLQEHVLEDGVGKQVKKGKDMPKVLTEVNNVQFTLSEDKNGKLIARGEFSRLGVPTLNGRIYTESVMRRAISNIQEDIKNRRVYGCLDHPKDGKTSLWDVSHVITGLKIENGIVIGEAEILKNTKAGQQIKALIESNVPVPVSSRGIGSTRPSSDPKVEGEVVQDDFVLKTWDFVADPAMKTAVPAIFVEDVNELQPDIAQLFLEEFPGIAKSIQDDAIENAKLKVSTGVEEAVEKAKEQVRAELTETFEKQLANVLVEAKEEISKELKEEYAADPDVGGAKAILSAILDIVSPLRMNEDEKAKVDADKARELEFAELKDNLEKTKKRAVAAECMEYIERGINGHPMSESIRSLVSGHEFKDVKDAKEKLETILKDMPGKVEGHVSEDEAKLREENASMRERITQLTEKVKKIDSSLKRAVEVGLKADAQLEDAESRVSDLERQLQEAVDEKKSVLSELKEQLKLADEKTHLEVYKRDMVARFGNRDELLSLMEDASSIAAVDDVVKKRGIENVSRQELNEARESLKRGYGSKGDKEMKSGSNMRKDMFGNDMSEIMRLAGIG